ncbi:MAG: hypothetical protein M9894_27755 [Planctomycetes bacterium]|nr:hypothetical protein [Planctomycetota bacterium]
MSPAPPRAALALAALALLSQALWASLALTGDLRHGALPGALAHLGALAALYLLALALVLRARTDDRRLLAVVWGAALLFRLTLLPVEPSLSTDAWRYVWEGRVSLAGHDPYALAPDAPLLEDLRDDRVWPQVNHPEVPAIYGPVLQALFALLALLPGGLWPFKLAFVAADLGVGLLLARALRRRGRPPALALAWLWHPLPVLEVAGQAHLEVVPIALLLLALDLEATGRARAAALSLGAAIGAKYLPVLVAPALLARHPRRAPTLLLLLALPGAACALPYLGGLLRPADTGLGAYAATWRFNDGGFLLLSSALEATGLSQAFCRLALPAFVDVPAGVDPALDATWRLIAPKLVAGALIAALALRQALRAPAARDLSGAAFAAGAGFLLLSPVVHPWYALWVVPLLPLRRSPGPWLLFSLCLPLAYAVLVTYDGTPATWTEEPWVRLAVYLPAAAWAATLSVVPGPRPDYQV